MPRVRKLTADEIERIEHRQQRANRADDMFFVTYGLADDEGPHPPPVRNGTWRPAPRLGDIVQLPGEATGIVVRVRGRTGGAWDAAELLAGGRRVWMLASAVGPAIGRPRGVSRIDQPQRRTHGWYVRVGSGPSHTARLFSDNVYHGRAAALAAALAFQRATEARLQPALASAE